MLISFAYLYFYKLHWYGCVLKLIDMLNICLIHTIRTFQKHDHFWRLHQPWRRADIWTEQNITSRSRSRMFKNAQQKFIFQRCITKRLGIYLTLLQSFVYWFTTFPFQTQENYSVQSVTLNIIKRIISISLLLKLLGNGTQNIINSL